MKIFFYPSSSKYNKYIKNLLNHCENRSIDIVNKDKNNDFISMILWGSIYALIKKTKIFHFNWILDFGSELTLKSYIKSFIFIFWIKFLKIFNCQLVWTMHNKIPHDTKNKKLVLYLRKFLINNFDRIIIHCESTKNILKDIINENIIDKKVRYIPHGNYIDSYCKTNVNKREEFGIDKNEFVFLFIGMIRSYKNVDLLINVFEDLDLDNAKLLIAGNIENKDLKETIFKLTKDNEKIIFSPGFIPEEKITSYLNTAEVLVLPYDKTSVLNSGTVYMSFSYKLPVIVPNIGSVKDIGDKKFIFDYCYNNKKQHYFALRKKIHNCYNEFKNNKKTLENYGLNAFEYVKKNNDWGQITRKLKKSYEEIS
ncbi:glycosyltransferase family 4 protein [Halanaerobaculum tunisiense]